METEESERFEGGGEKDEASTKEGGGVGGLGDWLDDPQRVFHSKREDIYYFLSRPKLHTIGPILYLDH
ncbi:hypothetical protein AAMO2058_001285500 [Amorphochlora amoebiformis]